MSISQNHLSKNPIPAGYQIFEERLEVKGVQHRRKNAVEFGSARNLSLELERDPGNKWDSNSIKVIGIVSSERAVKRYFIGYVPQKVAAKIVEGGYYESIKPRLLKTYVSDKDFVEILFQIVGPKEEFRNYRDSAINPQSAVSSSETRYSGKKVNWILALAIFFAPYVFSWILLRKGYSPTSRFLGFGWLVILMFSLLTKS